jgi:hypothetical protein
MRFARSFRCALTCVLAFVPAAADEPSELDPGIPRAEIPQVDAPTGPLAVFAEIERVWVECDPEALTALLDPVEKVSLSFTDGGPRGGYFNRDQAFFLLKDLLEFNRTDRFEFQKYWNLQSEGRAPYAVAVREFRMNDGARHTDQVYISLRRRGDDWFVGEIRSIDR